MTLTRLEREAITDSVLKIQSIQSSLEHVNEASIPNLEEIESCLQSADKRLRIVLRSDASSKKPTTR